MQILVKCWMPEFYDAVIHAIIEVDIELLEMLAGRIIQANKAKQADPEFMGMQFSRHDPYFLDLGDPGRLGLTDEDADDGFTVVPLVMHDDSLEESAVDMGGSCILMVMAGDVDHHRLSERVAHGRVYWSACDKHGGSTCRAETYSLYGTDLQELARQFDVKLCEGCGKRLSLKVVTPFCTECTEAARLKLIVTLTRLR